MSLPRSLTESFVVYVPPFPFAVHTNVSFENIIPSNKEKKTTILSIKNVFNMERILICVDLVMVV